MIKVRWPKWKVSLDHITVRLDQSISLTVCPHDYSTRRFIQQRNERATKLKEMAQDERTSSIRFCQLLYPRNVDWRARLEQHSSMMEDRAEWKKEIIAIIPCSWRWGCRSRCLRCCRIRSSSDRLRQESRRCAPRWRIVCESNGELESAPVGFSATVPADG